jgi:anti-sigma regulatory factor (Ser/Thr protein kinase)
MSHTATAPPLAWSCAYPATAAHVSQARRSLARALNGYPVTDDAALCLSEIATNACLHSQSREPGGHFTVRAAIDGSRLRVEVHDDGGPWTRPVRRRDGQHGRGLLILAQLADAWGRTGDSATGWTVWFTMTLSGPAATSSQHPKGQP